MKNIVKNAFRINSKIWAVIAVPVLSFVFALSGYASSNVYAHTHTLTMQKNLDDADFTYVDYGDGSFNILAEAQVYAPQFQEYGISEVNFKKWVVVSGDAEITSPTSNDTYVTINSDATIKAYYGFDVTVSYGSNGTLTANVPVALPGETVTLTPDPDPDYRLARYTVTPSYISISNNQFTMQDGDVSVTANFEQIPPTYTITFEPNGGNFNGSTTAATRTTGTDGKLTEFPQVQYNGHTFDGWFDDATSTTTRVGLDKVYSGATTLTAHWTETPSNPVCTGASINAPSQLVKGQSYNIPFIFTFNRDLTDADHQFISDNAAVRYSVNYKSGTSEDTYRNNTYTWMYPISIPLDATGSLTLQIVFEGEDQDTKTIPIVDPSPTTNTVTFRVVNGKWNDDSKGNKTEQVETNGHLTEAQIPTVGSIPNAGYKAGSWSPSTPNTTTSITGDVTYTYTYAQDEPTPPAPTTHTVTYKVVNGKWNDDTTGDKSETVEDNGHPANIPAVGNKPSSGFKAGSWSPSTPNTTSITGDVTYTYTYAQDEPTPPSPTAHTVTYKVVNGKWNDDTTGNKSETVEDNGHLAHIPAVGDKPSAGFKAGSWSPSTPNTSTAITSDKEYTYTYVPESATTYTVTATTDGHGNATANPTSGKSGTNVALKAVSDAGYKFKKWKVVSGGIELTDATKAKTTFKIKNANVKVKAIFEKIYEAPQPDIEPVDDDKIILAWFRVDEAKGYDIFMSRCDHDGKEITPKLIKTIKNKNTTKWTVTGLKPNKSYKAIIKAYTKDKNGKKKYISKSPLMHVYTAGGNKTYTNAKSVKIDKSDGKIKKGNKLTLKVKDTYNIKASVKKADKSRELMPDSHVKTLRYRSSDPGVASVGASGKITAKKPGKCKIYVYAHNGVNKTINLTVK